MTIKGLFLIITLILISFSSDQGDWVDPNRLPIPFFVRPFYGGYLKIKGNKSLYYIYTPSQSNPSQDPLIVVLSPNPGCSVLHSWLYSKGQFVFTRNTTNFRDNQYKWNRKANVLYIDGPAGTGFSYGGSGTGNDNITTDQIFWSILKFYQKFPELKDQKLYITGYGYAGVIGPRVALRIVEHNADPDSSAWTKINLGGMMLLNPCTLSSECGSTFQFSYNTIQFLRRHFFISKQIYEQYLSKCTLRTSACEQIEQLIQSKFRITGADTHNLYKQCIHQPGDYPCIDHNGIDIFLNVKEVRQDLNVQTQQKWQLCNATFRQTYQRDQDGSLHTYRTLLRQEHNLTIWIVSGTLSSIAPTFGTKGWIDELKMDFRRPTTRVWQPWFYQNINAGDIQQFPGLSLITVRTAGMYIFEDQPQIASHIYDSFFNGVRL